MYFPTTHWSLLARASLNGETPARQALDDLCHRYWSPLQRFIRSRGYTDAEAQDLTQDFLLHLLDHATLSKADRMRGRFRSFLLGSLVRFLSDERDRRHAQKRGSGAVHLSVDLEDPQLPPAADSSAMLFDREWALAVLENALRAAQQDFSSPEQAGQFSVLRRFLPGSLETISYDQAAAELGLTLPALKSELHRLRRRFKLLVRQEILRTISAPHEIDEEIAHLQRVLMDRGNNWAGNHNHSSANP